MEHGPITLEHARIIAYHEAGHAVATTMRWDARLTSVDLRRRSGQDAMTYMSHRPVDTPFLCFAGPWAELRYLWGTRPLDDVHEDGCTFHEALDGMWDPGAPGYQDWEAARPYDPLATRPAGMSFSQWGQAFADRQDKWCRELEQVWPLVTAVAEHLVLHQSLTPDELDELVEVNAAG